MLYHASDITINMLGFVDNNNNISGDEDVPYLIFFERHSTPVDQHVMRCATIGMGNEAG